MTQATGWYDAIVDEVRSLWQAGDDGGLWSVLVDEDRNVGAILAVTEGADRFDALACRALADILSGTSAKEVLIVIPRADGRARPMDIVLWHQLRCTLTDRGPKLLDLLIVGQRAIWSLRRVSHGVTGYRARPI